MQGPFLPSFTDSDYNDQFLCNIQPFDDPISPMYSEINPFYENQLWRGMQSTRECSVTSTKGMNLWLQFVVF